MRASKSTIRSSMSGETDSEINNKRANHPHQETVSLTSRILSRVDEPRKPVAERLTVEGPGTIPREPREKELLEMSKGVNKLTYCSWEPHRGGWPRRHLVQVKRDLQVTARSADNSQRPLGWKGKGHKLVFYVKVEEGPAEEPLFEGTRGANKVITGPARPSAKTKSPERFTSHESEHYVDRAGPDHPKQRLDLVCRILHCNCSEIPTRQLWPPHIMTGRQRTLSELIKYLPEISLGRRSCVGQRADSAEVITRECQVTSWWDAAGMLVNTFVLETTINVLCNH